ncbi:MAG: hypothetical protein LBK73_03820 [Treponema sp.]|nr:hypothetical protein [Treponema sp.]
MYCVYLPSTSSYAVFTTQRTNTIPSVSGGVTRWAIGGFDLMMSGTYSSSSVFKSAIDARFSSSPDAYAGNITDNWLPGYANSTPRTAIGCRTINGGVEVIFGTFSGGTSGSPSYTSGPTIFELHKIMKYIGCSGVL